MRLGAIQVLRGLAALIVVLHHAALEALARSAELGPSFLVPSLAIAHVGAIGVDLFFVISGFVMALSASKFTGLRGAGSFLAQRYNRIAPLFYLFCLVMLADRLRAGVPVGTQELVNSLIFIPFFDGADYSWPLHYLGWTLGFEFIFYLFVAVLIAGGIGSRTGVLLAVVATVPLLGLITGHGSIAWRMFTNPILWEFALGVAAYLLWRRGVLQRHRVALVAAAVSSMALVARSMALDTSVEPFIGAGGTVDGSGSVTRVLYWGLPSFLVFCFAISLDGDRPTPGIGLLRRIGDASYSLYLAHLPVILVGRAVIVRFFDGPSPDGSADLALVAMTVVSVGISLLVYRWVEKPMLDFGQHRIRRWFAGERAKPANAGATGDQVPRRVRSEWEI